MAIQKALFIPLPVLNASGAEIQKNKKNTATLVPSFNIFIFLKFNPSNEKIFAGQ
jgi:hypothetical protein